jgi:hypothetical protein
LVSESGLLARLRSAAGLDRQAVEETFAALEVLKQSWLGQLSVPKRAVFALAHAVDAFGSLSCRYPDLELWKLESAFTEHIEQALRPQEWALADAHLAEDSPARFLVDVFSGEQPFLIDLREAQGIDWPIVNQIFDAFDTLQTEWMDRERIPKAVALVLTTARGAISGC